MKHFSILIIIVITILSCNSKLETKDKANENLTEQKYGKKFFDYDEIDHYSTNFDDEKIGELFDNKSKSEIDSIKMGVILDKIPNNISDLSFIQKLERIGYKKSIVDKSKFKYIDKIFVEKSVRENIATACIYVYRDILIFKKENKVIGTAKICFDCLASQINGTEANIENFGQDGDYGKLETILRK